MTVEEKINEITNGKPNYLSITFNDHWAAHEPIERALEDISDRDFAAPDERQKCLESNSIWEVHYYPVTPVGFVHCYASTLDAALDGLLKLL
ncbi:MAG TPA: hypothetical protein VHU19_14325 [Pyrinomonadaceae bacterium]|jgi:hypothetical protein|nr:hypothetical protein [Pyrinomonadaceae bacterium]